MAGRCEVLVEREQKRLNKHPRVAGGTYLPARIGERYRRQFGAITLGNGNGTAPAATDGKAVGGKGFRRI